VPPTDIQDLRDLTRYRAELVQTQNKLTTASASRNCWSHARSSSVLLRPTLGASGRLMIEAIMAG